jgi:hypothetical protein
MDCREVFSLADDYVFGLLEPDTGRELLAHTSSCEACADAVEEARSRRDLFSAWEIKDQPAGAADRLLARIRTRKLKRRAPGRLIVRILSAAAVILAAVVLPRLFLIESPRVMSYVPVFTGWEGVFNESVRQEIEVPEERSANPCLIVSLKSVDSEAPVWVAIRLNEGEEGFILSAAAGSEEVFVLTREHGLKPGSNLLTINNLDLMPLEFEVTLVTGKTR